MKAIILGAAIAGLVAAAARAGPFILDDEDLARFRSIVLATLSWREAPPAAEEDLAPAALPPNEAQRTLSKATPPVRPAGSTKASLRVDAARGKAARALMKVSPKPAPAEKTIYLTGGQRFLTDPEADLITAAGFLLHISPAGLVSSDALQVRTGRFMTIPVSHQMMGGAVQVAPPPSALMVTGFGDQ